MKNIIVSDLDGTLADVTHRLHFIEGKKKDWDAFTAACADDRPIQTTIDTVNYMVDGYTVRHGKKPELWVITGRSDSAKKATVEWLNRNSVPYDKLIMRPDKDHTEDHKYKAKLMSEGTLPKERVMCVFEDRDRVVDMWRAHGIICYQVSDGEF